MGALIDRAAHVIFSRTSCEERYRFRHVRGRDGTPGHLAGAAENRLAVAVHDEETAGRGPAFIVSSMYF